MQGPDELLRIGKKFIKSIKEIVKIILYLANAMVKKLFMHYSLKEGSLPAIFERCCTV